MLIKAALSSSLPGKLNQKFSSKNMYSKEIKSIEATLEDKCIQRVITRKV